MAKARPTLWYRIGRSNWYTRTDARGRTVKRQGREDTFGGYNNIIRGLRRYAAERRAFGKKLDADVFETKRPETAVLITIKRKDGEIIQRADVAPQDYYKFFKQHFNLNYEAMLLGEIYYTIEEAEWIIQVAPTVAAK